MIQGTRPNTAAPVLNDSPAGLAAWILEKFNVQRWTEMPILLVITDKLTDHLKIDSFGWALGGALVMSLFGTLGEWLVRSVF